MCTHSSVTQYQESDALFTELLLFFSTYNLKFNTLICKLLPFGFEEQIKIQSLTSHPAAPTLGWSFVVRKRFLGLRSKTGIYVKV